MIDPNSYKDCIPLGQFNLNNRLRRLLEPACHVEKRLPCQSGIRLRRPEDN